MGPRLDGRGWQLVASPTAHTALLQWGRAWMGADGPLPACQGPPPASFNGAAPGWARMGRGQTPATKPSSRFNGAAPGWARMATAVSCQIGRDLSRNAE